MPVLPAVPTFSEFESAHLLQERPVVMEGLLEQMTSRSGFDLAAGEEGGAASGRAAISIVMPVTFLFGPCSWG